MNNISIIDNDLLSEFTPLDTIDDLGNSKLIKYNFDLEYDNTKVNLKIISKKIINKSVINRIIKNIFLMVSIKKQQTNNIEDFELVLIIYLYQTFYS